MKRLLLAALLATALSGVEVPLDGDLWEKPTWNTWRSVMKDDPSRPVLMLVTKTPDWHAQVKTWLVYDAEVARVVFTGEMRTDQVQAGAQSSEAARAQLSFHDRNGDLVGAWPGTTNRSGTTPWAPFSQQHHPEPGTQAVQVWLGMYLSRGTACYRNLQLRAFDPQGQELTPRPGRPLLDRPTTGWKPLVLPAENTDAPRLLDLTASNDAPAGRHGPIHAVGEDLVCADGTAMRFWGTGSWDYQVEAGELARRLDRLARWGANMLRLHGIDAEDPAQSLIDYAAERKQLLRGDRLEQLDRTIAEARRRGIYIYLDLLTKRRFTTAEGVIEPERLHIGGKPAVMWNRRLIELQKEYAAALLGHRNPLTGQRLADDAAIAMVGIINEMTMLDANAFRGVPTAYLSELDALFAAWCQEHGQAHPGPGFPQHVGRKHPGAWAFAADTERRYYREMEQCVRSLGYRGLLTGTNWQAQPANLANCAALGFVDRHFYWDHPSGGWSPKDKFHNRPHAGSLAMFAEIAGQRVAGVPYVITEWNFCWANEWLLEGPLQMAAFGSYQNYAALLNFSMLGQDLQPTMQGCFASDSKPQVVPALVFSGLIYRRGDVAPGQAIERTLAPDRINGDAGEGVTVAQALSGRIGLRFAPATSPATPAPTGTAPIRHHQGQAFVVDTPATQGFVGSLDGPLATRDAVFTTQTPFCQVVATTLDGHPLNASRRILVLTTARAQNSGQIRHAFAKRMLDEGRAPILLEPVRAQLDLALPAGAGSPSATTLDWEGRAAGAVAVIVSGGRCRLDFTEVSSPWVLISY